MCNRYILREKYNRNIPRPRGLCSKCSVFDFRVTGIFDEHKYIKIIITTYHFMSVVIHRKTFYVSDIHVTPVIARTSPEITLLSRVRPAVTAHEYRTKLRCVVRQTTISTRVHDAAEASSAFAGGQRVHCPGRAAGSASAENQ